ncbi:MAG: DUF1292 domain-containing protein [Clostridia bacterium]|nr:DUF1292 domain-containing protein [Clostridia bacterium]
MEELDNIVVLNDEDGEEIRFEFLDLIEYKGGEYVVLLPCDDPEGEEVVILQVESNEEEDTESYVAIEDEDILSAVFEIFKENFKDEFNFID